MKQLMIVLLGFLCFGMGIEGVGEPVLVYRFDNPHSYALRDSSGQGNHATSLEPLRYSTAAAAGPGLLFAGSNVVTARDSASLQVSDALTLDVWLQVDDISQSGCVLDKRGERYRLALSGNGRFFFGLKGEGRRVDLYGDGLQPGRLQRITATFDRPRLTLYLDGRQVAETSWDHAIDPGGPLLLGSKAGVTDFFRGALHQVHIYRYARPPQEGDAQRYRVQERDAMQQAATVEQTTGAIRVTTPSLEAVIDATTGTLRDLKVGEKVLIRDNDTAPVFAELLQSPDLDPLSDYAAGEAVPGTWQPIEVTHESAAGQVVVHGAGQVVFPGGDRLAVRLAYVFGAGRHMQIRLALTPEGAFEHRFIRAIGLSQPLALASRKRVIMAGDQGLRWDVRHRYQFHTHTTFLEEPDHNWWRRFYVDQESGHSYTIWRAESEHTAPLVDFRGRRAAGWMGLYDQGGGALVAYRRLAERAPKCLYVDAADGGRATVYLHAPTHAAAAPANPDTIQSLFGDDHVVDWVFFAGEEAFEQPARELAQVWGVETLPNDGPNRFDLPATEEDYNGPAAPAGLSPMVQGGVPLPRGALRDVRRIRLFVGDRDTPVSARPLAYWPDRSIKWLLLIFPLQGEALTPGRGEGLTVPFRVTLRRGEPQACRLVVGEGVQPATAADNVAVVRRGDTTVVDTGSLRLTFGTGRAWLRSAVLQGRELMRNADSTVALAHVDMLRPQEYCSGTTHPFGELDPGPVEITDIAVEEDDGLRAVIRLEGQSRGQEPARVILRLEVWAGRPFVRLFHTVEFLHEDPRQAMVRRLGLSLPLAWEGQVAATAGGSAGPVPISLGDACGLRQTSHLNYEIWQQRLPDQWRRILDKGDRSRGWFDVADLGGGVCVIQRDMWQEAPKELSYRQDTAELGIGYWPASSPLMDCRRYSDYPHRAQGESTPADARWVLDNWYANDPVKGISRTHETILFFHSAVAPGVLDSVAADFQDRPLLIAPWQTYADTGVTIPLAAAGGDAFAALNANCENLADWWLFHQRAWGWYGFWDYGDVQHHFRSGYGRIFPPDVLARIVALPADERAAVRPGSEFPAVQDYFTQNDWAYDNGRWGWSNTEGLINHFMSQMYLRTGRRDLFFFLEANARHVRDVDARHAGMWFGAGTRHGVQHWSDGNHEERQTTFTEQRFHYLLTGEHRTREWNRELSEKHYLQGTCRVHAAHSGRTYGLLTHWEMSGDPAVGRIVRDYMRALCTPSGVAIYTEVSFPDAVRVGEPEQINGESMFFHTFGGMHALLEYYELTQDPVVREALVATADSALAGGAKAVGGMLRKAVAFAARYADEPEPYREALRQYYAAAGADYAFRQVSAKPAHWSGETSFLVGNVSGGLFWANDALYVLGCLEQEPRPEAAILERFRQSDNRPVIQGLPLPRGSWQDAYDRPEFQEYLRDRLRP